MNELISRQAAIKSVTQEYNRRRTGDGLKLAWIEKAINDTPSAEPKEWWIPVEEALPNDHETYLLTHEIRYITGRCRNEVTMAYYDDENGDWLTDAESPEIISYPLAWRELPKPFKQKGNK